MMRKSIGVTPPTHLPRNDLTKCQCVAHYIILQCLIVFAAAITVQRCLWTLELEVPSELYRLACIMYLYDKSACGHTMTEAKSIKSLHLSNDTRGLALQAIQWKPLLATASSRLSEKLRIHIDVSIGIHAIWCFTAIVFRIITRNNNHPKLLRIILTVLFLVTIGVILFDFSMGIVYVSHITQSLTKGMIIRYSGWDLERAKIRIEEDGDFGGWLPITASLCWLKGVVFTIFNILSLKSLYHIMAKIKKRIILKRFENENNLPIPEVRETRVRLKRGVLYYRPGESKPFTQTYLF